MKTRARVATWQRLRQQPTWKLLAADNAPLIAALLQALLLDGERKLPASLLHERLARELDELAEDFRHVRDDFQRLDREFRERIIDGERQRGEMLEALFAGVDAIAESDSGRSFDAFWRLLTDAEQSGQLEATVDAVTSRDFARQLDRRGRAFLLHLTRTLLDRGGHVHDVLQHFARSLKGFVQSRAYLEQRRLHQLLKQTQAEALKLRDQYAATRASATR